MGDDSVNLSPFYEAFAILTLAAIGGLGIVIGYAIAQRDRRDDTFPETFWTRDEAEAVQRDPRPDELAN